MEENTQEEVQEETPQAEEPVVAAEPVASDDTDAEKNKGMAILAYFIFFIPMLTDAKESKFAMFHANQSLVLMLTLVGVSVIGGIIPFLGWFIILPLGYLFVFILAILGLINAASGKTKELPLIGGIHILDKK
jgi:uncharacterized membrane protein